MNTYCLIQNGVVANRTIFEDTIPQDWPDAVDWVESDTAQIGWNYAAGVFSAPPLPPLPPLTEVDYKNAIVAMMDAKAQERRYDSALSLSTYVGSTNAAWAAEASAFVEWRDAVWAYCYEQLALVAIQRRSQPTIAEFLAELPPMVWPTA